MVVVVGGKFFWYGMVNSMYTSETLDFVLSLKTLSCYLFGGYMQRRLTQFIFLARTESRPTEIADELRAGEEVPDLPRPGLCLGEGAGDSYSGAGADRQVKQRLRGVGPWGQVTSLAHGGVGGALLLKYQTIVKLRCQGLSLSHFS